MSKPKHEGQLLARVRAMLGAETAPPALEIYKATGIAPNRLWSIKAGKTKDPSVNDIEALYRYLSGSPLEL